MVKKNKRAVFFSIDALIALTIILLTILVIFPIVKYSQKEDLIQSDVLEVLSSLKVGEIDNAYIQGLITSGDITDSNKTVLEQIGEFYIIDEEVAKNMANQMISSIDTSENIGIWFGNDLLASKNSTSYENAIDVDVKKQILSGIRDVSEEGGAATAFSARAFLTSNVRTKYFYFGGYVGDGNLSFNVDYEGELIDMSFEIAINDEFDLLINGLPSGHYSASPTDEIPASYSPSYESYFNEGTNTLEIVGDDLHISGGYIKLVYENSVQYEQPFEYSFPGIDGVINLYDSFYIPGVLTDISIYLHYKSAYEMFLNIGEINVFNGSSPVETTEFITNSELSTKLDYNLLSKRTIPLRLGLLNVSYVSGETRDADVFSVTDLSGSMGSTCTGASPFYCCWFNDCSNQAGCEDSCGGTLSSKIQDAKDANKAFIDLILNASGNRAGLVGYSTTVSDSDYHALSDDNVSLKSKVDDWDAGGNTCICCGINRAISELNSDSSPEKFKSMVVMSDGDANVECGEQGFTADLNGNGNADDAGDDAIQAACEAYENYGISVYTIGFGTLSQFAIDTLQGIANCGNGTYIYASVTELEDVYRQIANDILEASYSEQTIEVSGEFNNTILYPDSYISFNYDSEEIPFGLITTIETDDFGNSVTEGSFFVPTDAEIIEANVISYSGAKWTDNVYVFNTTLSSWENIFSLPSYGTDYVNLGDPYVVNLPLNYLKNGDNLVKITSGISPSNSTGSSPSDKAIYTIMRSASGYSDISAFANGCNWTIQFEDETTLNVDIPATYAGDETCLYTNSSHLAPAIGKDSMQSAVYNLLKLLDLDLDGKLDVKFTKQDLSIDASEITGIPYDYSVEVQVRKWQ